MAFAPPHTIEYVLANSGVLTNTDNLFLGGINETIKEPLNF